MGSEYVLGCHGAMPTVTGTGISLMAYEQSGTFDVYADLPHDRVDPDAWLTCTRVDLWDGLDPADLYKIGKHIMTVAERHMTPEEVKALRI